jgi:hypothetical protein
MLLSELKSLKLSYSIMVLQNVINILVRQIMWNILTNWVPVRLL